MRLNCLILLGFCCMLFTPTLFAQEEIVENTLTYQAEAFGSAASGDYTPFWITSNKYGVVPLDAGNGYFRTGVTQHQTLGKGFHWGAKLDALVVAPRYRNVYIHQLYAEIGYKNLLLSVGNKERNNSLWDKHLSSGDMIQSTNARPIPEVNLSLPQFTVVPFTKGWLQVKGDVAVGRSFDTAYLDDFIQTSQNYIQDVLWHHKSAFIRVQDSRNHFPIGLTFGIQHMAQWGGTSTNPQLGKQPQSLKNLARVFWGKSGGSDASLSDQINVLGNHHISYDYKLSFLKETWAVHAYHQHISSDKSGLLLYNGADGLWGLHADLHKSSWVKKVVLEYITTRNQSGPFHYINFDHDKHPGRGGGADDYYNNGEYTTGLSYFNRGIGTPLTPSPEYNEDGKIGFKNNRIQDWHLGLEGELSPQLSYRFLMTVMNGWGTHYAPLLKKQSGTSLLIDLFYTHPRLSDWSFTGSIGGDTGDIVGNKSLGFSLGVKRTGLLKTWK